MSRIIERANDRDLLDSTRSHEIYDLIGQGREQYGSQTFDQHLVEHVEAERVSFEVAKAAANNPSDFELQLRTLV